MKFLTDENIGIKVVKFLRSRRHNVLSVLETKELRGSDDGFLISLANKENRIIITLDKDFGELVFRQSKQSSGVILLRLFNETEDNIIKALSQFFKLKINPKNKFVLLLDDRAKIRDIK